MNDPTVYLNGSFTPLSEAKVPVMDRGFIFGDGVYEVIPVYRRRVFGAREHMARLQRSLDKIGLENPHSEAEWMELVGKLIDPTSDAPQLVYLQVTRGVAWPRLHAFPEKAVPTVFIMCNPMSQPPAVQREKGLACVSMDDLRWSRNDIKAVSLLGSVLAAQHAVEEGANDVVQFRDGFLTEAAAANVWVVKDGAVCGPLKDSNILEGIRYGMLERLCAREGIPFSLRRIPKEEVLAADELMLSSATKQVLPVTSLDGRPVGSGKPGPVYAKLYAAYQAAIADACEA